VLAVALAAADIAPIGTGRTDIYLYPTLLIVVAVAFDIVARLLPRPLRAISFAVVLIAVALAPLRLPLPEYVQQDIRPLVEELEAQRRPGDATLVYSFGSFAFALYTSSPVDLVPSSDYATGWAIEVRDPDVVVLPPHRLDPAEYEPVVTEAIEGRDRVWLIASHMGPDFEEIRRVLEANGFTRESVDTRSGAELDLWVRPSTGA
jgi:hypothetical protein